MRTRGSVLVGLLWCLALLSVLVVGVLHTATLEARLAKNHGDEIQARYLALAGLEKAKALLYHEAWERRRGHVHHSGKLENAPEEFKDVALGRGLFRVYHEGRGGRERRGELVYGVTDEESRLDVNRASLEELSRLPGLTLEEAAAIVDYRDRDNEVTQGGAESEQYTARRPSRRPRNGAFLTRRELLSVLGLSAELFHGEDANLNGLLDADENDGAASLPADDADGFLDAGWSELIAVDTQARNVNAAGQGRVNLKEADAAELSAVPGLSLDLARAIVQFREGRNFDSLADLLDVTAPAPNNTPRPPGNASASPGARGSVGGAIPGGVVPNAGSPAGTPISPGAGAPLISESLFMEIADDLTTQTEMNRPGVVNVNTASEEVLRCLEGITRELAHEIVSHRESAGYFANTARLLEVPGLTRDIWKGIAPRITARSQTFRLLSEGVVPATGARHRVESVVRVGTFYVDTLAHREDDL